jgi:[ribosomal protein S18]-alanine N-acetyltransferase
MRLWTAPAGLHIEPAQVADADALARLHAAAFYRGWPVEDFETYIAAQDTPTLAACDARRRIAGFATMRLSADEAELLTIVVDRKWRGKGLGGALMRAAFDDLMRSPAKALFLEVEEGNGPALRLYRGFGFDEVGRRQGYYPRPDGGAATALVMRRNLG